MRLFVGIPLADAVIAELSATSARLRSGGDAFRWTAPESWHITLQFLGNAGQEQYECIVAQLHKLHLRSVLIQLEELGCFDRAGVFIAAVRVSTELLLLQRSVTAATADCGFASEARPYQPHITLGRSKGTSQRQSLSKLKSKIGSQPKFPSFVSGEFLLYESFLGPSGSRYEIREHFPLDEN